MKKAVLSFLIILYSTFIFSQVIDQEIESEKLGEKRNIRIQLPKNYDTNTEKTYPLFIVFDGDYLFDPVVGNVNHFTYWEDIPEAIIVGIDQETSRNYDTMYSEENFLPIESGDDLFEFVGLELVPYMELNYRTANFRIAVGHGKTANFINYYLFKNDPLFQAYISISPELAPEMEQHITESLLQFETKNFYYLASSTNDLKKVKQGVDVLNINLSSIENESLFYGFDNFEGPTHYSVATHAIPKALEHIFYAFQPISKKEYREKILVLDYSPVDYLKEKYAMVNDLFGITKKVLINDFRAISSAIEKNELYEYYQDLSRLASRDYPETLLGTYYLARYFEEMGEPKKAYRTYKSGYVLDEVAGISKDFMLEMAEQIKADFGF
ncbi:MAG: esterase [Bacteroidia bacterium]|nr:esterase [Bacteroidia bacterium]